MRRRDVLRLGAGGGLVAAVGAASSCSPEPAPARRVFDQGVASGLHSDSEVVLWSRVAPERAGGDVGLTWEVADDDTFANVVASGATSAQVGSDHTVKVLVGGLDPDRSWWYRFRHSAEDSPIGRARTLPAPGAAKTSMRFAFGSCQSYNAGYYAAWRDVAARDVDAVLFLGDYIYEAALINVLGSSRSGDSLATAETLEDYRAKYRLYTADADLQAARSAHPFVPIWDDHEIFNDYDRRVFVEEPVRAAGAYQAWFEYQPVWPVDGTRIYRDLSWGNLGHLFMLDGRQYRDPHRDGSLPAGARPIGAFETEVGRTLLGVDQRSWLLDGLTAAQGASTWKVIGNPVMIAPLRVLDLDSPELRAIDPDLPTHAGWYTNAGFDSWDGYTWERDLLLGHLAQHSIDNTVFVTGDYHSFWQSTLSTDYDDSAAPFVANEFAAGAISSGGGAINENILFGQAEYGPYQPAFNFIEGQLNGYGLLEATHDELSVTFMGNNATYRTPLPQPIANFTLEAGDPTVSMG
ncbi:MAG: alkaline phosphatase D family protein [Microthrixaceae bacterium]